MKLISSRPRAGSIFPVERGGSSDPEPVEFDLEVHGSVLSAVQDGPVLAVFVSALSPRHADVVGVEGDAHEAFPRPETWGVADETEDIGSGFDHERFHGPSLSEAVSPVGEWALGSGVVLIEAPPLGMRGRSATWGTGNDPKVREERSGAPSEVLDWGRRKTPWLRGGPAQR
jgi:hypothetical protein